ncbi:MAG: anti-sigma factor [Marmoricola sp.]
MNDLHAMSGAYAVDALDDIERARFERHLAGCPECADEVAGMREAAAMLAASVDAGPSPALRDRVLSEITMVRPLPPTAPGHEVVRRTSRWFPKLAAAAVAAVLLATGVSAWHPWSPTPGAQVSVASRVLDATDTRAQSVAFDDGSHATLYHSDSVGRAVLVTKGMAPAPAGKVYELWFQAKDGTFVPAGLMDSGGNQTVLLHGMLASSKGVGVTVEPASGSKHPTSLPVAMFDLRKSV